MSRDQWDARDGDPNCGDLSRGPHVEGVKQMMTDDFSRLLSFSPEFLRRCFGYRYLPDLTAREMPGLCVAWCLPARGIMTFRNMWGSALLSLRLNPDAFRGEGLGTEHLPGSGKGLSSLCTSALHLRWGTRLRPPGQ